MVGRAGLLLLIGLLTMPTLINHDYESGASLASLGYGAGSGGYIADLSNQSGQGLGGSTWGARGPLGGTAAQRYYAEATIEVLPTGRLFSISADFDHADAAYSQFGYSAFEMRREGGWFLSLYHGMGAGADRSLLTLYLANTQINYPDDWVSPVGTIVPGTTQNLKICGEQSSAWGVHDGWVKIYVDNVEIGFVENVLIYPQGGFGTWGRVLVNSMGRMDNLLITDDGCPVADPDVEVTDNADVCCSDGSANVVATGGGQGAGATPVQTPTIGGAALGCAGGGAVPTQADLVHSEAWWGA